MENIGTYNLSKMINKAENELSNVAKTPVLGILAGVTKMAGGGVQALSALACGIIVGIPLAATGKTSILNHSWVHLKHGLGNIAAGFFEAIPGVGTLLWHVRDMKRGGTTSDDPRGVRLDETKHDNKFMAYPELVRYDSSIGGLDDEKIKIAEKYYKDMTDFEKTGTPLSREDKYQIMKEAIKFGNAGGAVKESIKTKEGQFNPVNSNETKSVKSFIESLGKKTNEEKENLYVKVATDPSTSVVVKFSHVDNINFPNFLFGKNLNNDSVVIKLSDVQSIEEVKK